MTFVLAQSPVQTTTLQRAAPAKSLVCGRRFAFVARRPTALVARAETDEKPVTEKAEEAAGSVVDQAEEAFQQQADQVQDTVEKPLAEGKPATDPSNAWDESIKEAGKVETEQLGTQISFGDALRFRGVGPEHINSRLAMVGVTTGYLTKLITGKNTLDQYIAAPLPVILTFILFIAASLIPITKGVTPEKAENGIWTAKAEIYNGRLAMLGFISLIATDGWQWFSALQAAKGASLGA